MPLTNPFAQVASHLNDRSRQAVAAVTLAAAGAVAVAPQTVEAQPYNGVSNAQSTVQFNVSKSLGVPAAAIQAITNHARLDGDNTRFDENFGDIAVGQSGMIVSALPSGDPYTVGTAPLGSGSAFAGSVGADMQSVSISTAVGISNFASIQAGLGDFFSQVDATYGLTPQGTPHTFLIAPNSTLSFSAFGAVSMMQNFDPSSSFTSGSAGNAVFTVGPVQDLGGNVLPGSQACGFDITRFTTDGARTFNASQSVDCDATNTLANAWAQVTVYANAGTYAFVAQDVLGTEPLAVGVVPEPGTYALMALGLAGLAARRRQQQQQSEPMPHAA